MNEFLQRTEDTPGKFKSGGSSRYTRAGVRKTSFDPLAPMGRELEGFIGNLRSHPKVTDTWLVNYLADPTEVHSAFTAAVRAELERRKTR